MVMAELAGDYEAPIYGMLDVERLVQRRDWGAIPQPQILMHGQPANENTPSILWDGEWEITYVTFRDMGAAFMVAILGIYILVVAQFKSFKLPLVILTPIPLTLIGIVIGHLIFNAPFTATSMIGFIALAGIIVRNSILLVDFIRHAKTADRSMREVLLERPALVAEVGYRFTGGPHERAAIELTRRTFERAGLAPDAARLQVRAFGELMLSHAAMSAASITLPPDLQTREIEIGRAVYDLDAPDMAGYEAATFAMILDTYVDGLSAQARATKRVRVAS